MSAPHSASSRVRIRVPATSANLGPGFDSLGLALDLWNEIALQIGPADLCQARGEGAQSLPQNGPNIIHRAAHQTFEKLEIAVAGVELELENAIPFARGLGSSSAAIAGGIFAANQLARRDFGRFLSAAQCLDLATSIEGHPDNVAPALNGALVICATRDDGKVASVAPQIARFPQFCLWIPDTQLETKKARAALPETYARADAVFNLSRAALLVAALIEGDFSVLGEALRDKIHQDFRAPLIQGWEILHKSAQNAGALGVTLSGAGPTLLGWCETAANAVQLESAWQKSARENELGGRVLRVKPSEKGAHLVE